MKGNTPLIPLVLAAFILAAVFGLYVMALAPMQHEAGCPFMSPVAAVCAGTLAHVEHWQSALLAIVFEIFALAALALLFVRSELLKLPDRHLKWLWVQTASHRPTVLEELFARGILNPKVY